MDAELLEAFESSATDVGVSVIRTTTDEFAETVSELLTPPAVGVPIDSIDVAQPPSVETNPTLDDLEAAHTGITPVAFAIANYGSVVIRSTPAGEEPISLYVDHHVAVLPASDIEPDMGAAVARIGRSVRAGDGDLVIATGPSATADMGALVNGAHGPRQVDVVIVEDR